MSWGSALRDALRHSTADGQAAAREAAAGPQHAASVLSEGIAHTLQLALFAAQDMQRLASDASRLRPDHPTVPGMPSLQAVMDDLRRGCVAPERAEKQLREAAGAAARQAASGQGQTAGEELASERELRLAALRFAELRHQLAEQCAAVHQQMAALAAPEDGAAMSVVGAERKHNAEFAARLGQAFIEIDRIFLRKRVDDPAVPLAPDAPEHKQKAGA